MWTLGGRVSITPCSDQKPNFSREAVALVDAADQPLAAEDVVIDIVFVGGGAEASGAELKGHLSRLWWKLRFSSGQTASTTALISSVTVLRTGVSTT